MVSGVSGAESCCTSHGQPVSGARRRRITSHKGLRSAAVSLSGTGKRLAFENGRLSDLASWYVLNARRARSRGLMRDGDEEPMAVLIASSPAPGGWLDETLVGRRLRQQIGRAHVCTPVTHAQ